MIDLKIEVDALARFGQRLAHAKKVMPEQLGKMVQEVGPIATSQMKRVMPAQTGLKFGTINKALKGRAAGNRYEIRSKGGDIRLKFFSPRETRKGVSAAPWNKRQVFAGSFMNAGWTFPRSKPVRGKGNVWRREGKSKYPIKAAKSGLYIPNEMVTGQSAVVFYGTVDAHLAPKLEAILFSAL